MAYLVLITPSPFDPLLEVFLKLSHKLHFTELFIFRILSPPPFACVPVTLIWIFARFILYLLFHFVRESLSSTGELGEIHISHKDVLVDSNAFRKVLAPSRTMHMNTNTNGLFINPATFVQARKISCQTLLFPKVANYSVRISNAGREEEKISTATADGVLQAVSLSVLQFFSVF